MYYKILGLSVTCNVNGISWLI